MKKTTKNIIIALIVLLVLGGVFAVLYFTAPKEQAPVDDTTSSDTEKVDTTVIDKEAVDIDYVEISCENGDYKIIQTETETKEESKDDDGNTVTETVTELSYAYEGYEQYQIDYAALKKNVERLVSISFNKEIGKVDDLAEFGLSDSQAKTITVNYDNGTKDVIKVGIEGGSTYGYYICYNDNVYISYLSDDLFLEFIDLVMPVTFSSPAYDRGDGLGEYSTAEYVNLSGRNYPEEIKISYDTSTAKYMMNSPVESECSISRMDEVVLLLSGFSTTSVAALSPTEDELAEMGLADPFAVIDASINKLKVQLTFGDQIGTDRYFIIDGDTSVVYYVKASDFAILAESSATTLRNVYVYLPMIMKVDDFSIKTKDVDFTVDMSREVNEEKTTEETVVYTYTGTIDGTDVEYENITGFYGDMISIATIGVEELEHSSTPAITFEFNYYDGTKDVVEYFFANDDRYVAYINGKFTATTRATSIKTFEESAKAFLENNT